MDVQKLIDKLFNLWQILSEKNSAARQQLGRKIGSMRMDPKADHDLLSMLEALREEYEQCITLSYVGFYRLRVLKQLHDTRMAE